MRTIVGLAIHGGGIKGIIAARTLAAVEKAAGIPISKGFDFIAGTSTGSILTLALGTSDPKRPGKPRYSAGELVDIYRQLGPEIFKNKRAFGPLLRAKWDDAGLKRMLREYLGDRPIGETALTKLMTTGITLNGELVIVKSWKTRRTWGAHTGCWQAAWLSSAAPTFFPVADPKVGAKRRHVYDGGLWAQNPSMVVLNEMLELADKTKGPTRLVLVSVGTGAHDDDPLPEKKAKRGGIVQTAEWLITAQLEAQVRLVDYTLRRMPGLEYIELNPPLPSPITMDDASPATLRKMVSITNRWLMKNHVSIERVAAEMRKL